MKDETAENVERRETAWRGPRAGDHAGFLLRTVDLALAGTIFLRADGHGRTPSRGRADACRAGRDGRFGLGRTPGLARRLPPAPTWPATLFLAAVVLVLLQIVPLPPGVLQAVRRGRPRFRRSGSRAVLPARRETGLRSPSCPPKLAVAW